mmetsp:Transcript_32642/g.84289  ORF Transcript_32642/g.84289 Transcript_32642/m.84289 type:complete len:234 (-) Transcript_32642:402-1103(-)
MLFRGHDKASSKVAATTTCSPDLTASPTVEEASLRIEALISSHSFLPCFILLDGVATAATRLAVPTLIDRGEGAAPDDSIFPGEGAEIVGEGLETALFDCFLTSSPTTCADCSPTLPSVTSSFFTSPFPSAPPSFVSFNSSCPRLFSFSSTSLSSFTSFSSSSARWSDTSLFPSFGSASSTAIASFSFGRVCSTSFASMLTVAERLSSPSMSDSLIEEKNSFLARVGDARSGE